MNHRQLYIFSALLFSILILSGCAANKRIIRDTETIIKIDTITIRDTVNTVITLPPDTITKEIERIIPDSTKVKDFQDNKLTLGPWIAESERSKAISGIHNNKPYLWLFDKTLDLNLDVPIEYNQINTTKETNKNEIQEIIVEKTPPFYRNYWFYISVIIILGVILISKFKK